MFVWSSYDVICAKVKQLYKNEPHWYSSVVSANSKVKRENKELNRKIINAPTTAAWRLRVNVNKAM
jgi:hypothetical protein